MMQKPNELMTDLNIKSTEKELENVIVVCKTELIILTVAFALASFGLVWCVWNIVKFIFGIGGR